VGERGRRRREGGGGERKEEEEEERGRRRRRRRRRTAEGKAPIARTSRTDGAAAASRGRASPG
jgi:hypothetical protein